MNNAFLALTAAGFAGLSGYGINAQTSPIQKRKWWIPRQTIRKRRAYSHNG
jgi:hypothetical protein